MNYAKKLLQFRAEHNLTQSQLARLFNVAVLTIIRYEKGVSKPTAMKQLQFEKKMREKKLEENKNV